MQELIKRIQVHIDDPKFPTTISKTLLQQAVEALATLAPIDMVLFCPKCGVQHIDAPEGGLEAQPDGTTHYESTWTNPPHRSHLCHECGHVWRPADVPTNGVASVKTKGKDDDTPVSRARQEAPKKTNLVRYCGECGRIGEVIEKDAVNCCPDGHRAAYIPRGAARQAQARFFAMLGASRRDAQLSPQTPASTAATIQSMERAEWQAVADSLSEARTYLCKDGCNHTWLDGAIHLAKERAKGNGTYAYPAINAVFEVTHAGITGRTDAPIKRVDKQDDGSVTVIIAPWSQSFPSDTRRIDFLSQPSIETDFDFSDDGDAPHVIYRVHGSRNDLEYVELARGKTLRDAVDRAIDAAAKGTA